MLDLEVADHILVGEVDFVHAEAAARDDDAPAVEADVEVGGGGGLVHGGLVQVDEFHDFAFRPRRYELRYCREEVATSNH